MVSVTTFDIDDTLYPEYQYAASGLREVGGHLEQRYGIPGVQERLIQALDRGIRGRIFDVVLPKIGLSVSLVPELVERYRLHVPELGLYPDVVPALKHFRALGPTAIITDGPLICQQRKIEVLNLDSWFDLIVITDAAGSESWKPSPYGYVRVMEHFHAAGQNCCYVGDNPIKDFVAARRLGWLTVQIEREDQLNRYEAQGKECQPHHRIKSLVELSDYWPAPHPDRGRSEKTPPIDNGHRSPTKK